MYKPVIMSAKVVVSFEQAYLTMSIKNIMAEDMTRTIDQILGEVAEQIKPTKPKDQESGRGLGELFG